MAHSVELLFDSDSDDAIRRSWTALAKAGLPTQAAHRSPTNRPHVTVVVSDGVDPAADDSLRIEARESLPLPCRVGAPMLFGRDRFTLVRLIVPSPSLLGLHARVGALCAPFMPHGPFPHAASGHWTPHVTLARRMTADEVAAALAVIDTTEFDGAFTRLRRWDGDARVDTMLDS